MFGYWVVCIFQCVARPVGLEKFARQLFNRGRIGNAMVHRPKVDHIVRARRWTIGSIASPETSLGIEPQTRRVIRMERTETHPRVGAHRSQCHSSRDHFIQDQPRGFDVGNHTLSNLRRVLALSERMHSRGTGPVAAILFWQPFA